MAAEYARKRAQLADPDRPLRMLHEAYGIGVIQGLFFCDPQSPGPYPGQYRDPHDSQQMHGVRYGKKLQLLPEVTDAHT